MHTLRTRKSLVAASAAAVAALVSACGSSPSSTGSSSPPKKVSITIAYAAPVADHMVPAVTEAAGFFAKYGITAKIEYLQQSDLLPAMIAGKVQFATLAAPGYEIPDLTGSQFQVIGLFEDAFDSYFVAGPKYPTIASLSGQSVGISSAGSYGDLLAQIVERKYHITMHELPLGGNPETVAALESGTVAAKPDVSPSQWPAIQAKLPGAHILVNWRDVRGVPAISFVGYKPWLAAHRATVIDVMKAVNAGFAYFKKDAGPSINTIAKVTGDPVAEAKAGYEATLEELSPTTMPSLQDEKTVLSYLVKTYPQAAKFNAADFIDASYDKAAGG